MRDQINFHIYILIMYLNNKRYNLYIFLAANLLKLLAKYSPETKKDKKTRLQKEAETKVAGSKD